MEKDRTKLAPKEAVEKAFEHFRLFFAGQITDHVLLEELEHNDDKKEWRVVIGFDVGREKRGDGYGPASTSLLGGLMPHEREPIREYRTIYLNDSDGSFIRMS